MIVGMLFTETKKWFYMLRDGLVCRVFPTFRLNGDKEIESQVKMPACPKLYHKSRQPQVMFLAVTAKPRPEYSFDGKVGIWSFTRLRKAKRSVKKTGTVAGETDIFESVSVTAEEYRHVMLKRGGVFDALRQKMWWFARDADTLEAGCTLFYQHNGASPHTARANVKQWGCHGAKKFKIEVITQPPQSPDLNVNDLAFFRAFSLTVSSWQKKLRSS